MPTFAQARCQQMPLTDTQIKGLRPAQSPTKHSDGGGFHLLVAPTGGKLWRLSYRHGSRQKTLALGAYPILSATSRACLQIHTINSRGANMARSWSMTAWSARHAPNCFSRSSTGLEYCKRRQADGCRRRVRFLALSCPSALSMRTRNDRCASSPRGKFHITAMAAALGRMGNQA